MPRCLWKPPRAVGRARSLTSRTVATCNPRRFPAQFAGAQQELRSPVNLVRLFRKKNLRIVSLLHTRTCRDSQLIDDILSQSKGLGITETIAQNAEFPLNHRSRPTLFQRAALAEPILPLLRLKPGMSQKAGEVQSRVAEGDGGDCRQETQNNRDVFLGNLLRPLLVETTLQFS